MEIDGCIRVSDVLAFFQDFSKIPQDVLERKAEIGSRVHKRIEEFLRDEFPIFSEDIKGYMQSFIGWIEHRNVAVGLTEKRFFDHQRKLTGQVDAIFLINKILFIADFKTSYKPNDKIWKLQAGFYYTLVKESYPDLSKEVTFLHLKKNGDRADEYIYEITHEILMLCDYCLGVYKYFVSF